MSAESYNLYSAFDADKHKATYTNYLEVVIDEKGTVLYAVPSHQEKAIAIACEKLGVTRDELYDLCTKEYYFDFARWLCIVAEVVLVWNDFCIFAKPNRKQIAVLRMLKMKGLYKGAVPHISKKIGEK